MQPYYSRNGTINIHDMTSLTSTQQPSDRWNSPACQIPHIHRIIPQDRIEPSILKNRRIPRSISLQQSQQHISRYIPLVLVYYPPLTSWTIDIPRSPEIPDTWCCDIDVNLVFCRRERDVGWGWRFQECGERRVRPTNACFIFSNGMVDWVISDILCMLFQFYIQISGRCCGGCFGRFC